MFELWLRYNAKPSPTDSAWNTQFLLVKYNISKAIGFTIGHLTSNTLHKSIIFTGKILLLSNQVIVLDWYLSLIVMKLLSRSIMHETAVLLKLRIKYLWTYDRFLGSEFKFNWYSRLTLSKSSGEILSSSFRPKCWLNWSSESAYFRLRTIQPKLSSLNQCSSMDSVR